MKKLITIILALIMALFTAPNRSAERPPVTAEKTPQTVVTVTVEQVPEESETTAEMAFVSEVIGLKWSAIDFTENTLTVRHSCASVLLAQGVPMKQIQEWLGHSDMSTTVNVRNPHTNKMQVKAA